MGKFQFQLWKAEMFLRHYERKNKRMRRKYCHKGFHKLVKQTYSYKSNDKPWVHIRFLKCLHCNYLFFTTINEKKKYLEKEGTAKDGFSSFLKSLSGAKSTQFNSSGRDNEKEASASVIR